MSTNKVCIFFSLADGTCAGVRCHPDATCKQDTPLGPVCVCNTGYQGDGRKCTGKVIQLHFLTLIIRKKIWNFLFFLIGVEGEWKGSLTFLFISCYWEGWEACV